MGSDDQHDRLNHIAPHGSLDFSEQPAQKKRLSELRSERGLSREELAVALKTSYSTLVNIETGRNKPRVELAENIYTYFGVPVGSIAWGK